MYFEGKKEDRMKRDIERDLLRWKDQKQVLPLLLRGARQVGKSYIVEAFGKERFKACITLNFERNPEYKKCFASMDPLKISSAIELITGRRIEQGATLLFLDEIQECPEAVKALRYFKEEMPGLHVIGAGSLLEFILNDEALRMPVGRVQFMYLRPLSFGEYLDASGHSMLREHLKKTQIQDGIEEVIHDKLLSLVREYFAIGGMPAAVSAFLESKSLLSCQEIQTSILTAYRRDFGKYAGRIPHRHLETIFTKVPGLIGKWLKYSTLDPNVSSAVLQNALRKLCEAGLILLIYATSGAGLPLISHMNEKKCKFLFLDTGLVQRACNLDLELLFKKQLLLVNRGELAEQFAGQELLAYFGKDDFGALFSWMREEKSSSAEIDFLIAIESRMVPIEVKAGKIGSLRSLKIFLKEKNIPVGVRISESQLSLESHLLSIPLYMIEQLPRLVKEAYGKGAPGSGESL